jgi:hypothetical protein
MVFTPEGGDTLRLMLGLCRAIGGDMDLFLCGWTREAFNQTRAGENNNIDLKGPLISALILTQPNVLREVLGDKEAKERGLLRRILPMFIHVPPQEDDGEARTVDPEIEDAWRHLVAEVLDIRFKGGDPRKVCCTSEAREVFRGLHNETVGWMKGDLADMSSSLSSWREHALHLALVLSVANNLESVEVGRETAEQAVNLFRCIGARALQGLGENREAVIRERGKVLKGKIEAAKEGFLTARVCSRAGFELEELNQLCKIFPEVFRMSEHKPETGRPSIRVGLVPKSG